ncbi:MAG TPA: hypothetical protein PKI16_00035 [Candidatus Dojkabacteria bacterium]|nr:hypothetical protein [Candidatus Dojkabacteria bacterium]
MVNKKSSIPPKNIPLSEIGGMIKIAFKISSTGVEITYDKNLDIQKMFFILLYLYTSILIRAINNLGSASAQSSFISLDYNPRNKRISYKQGSIGEKHFTGTFEISDNAKNLLQLNLEGFKFFSSDASTELIMSLKKLQEFIIYTYKDEKKIHYAFRVIYKLLIRDNDNFEVTSKASSMEQMQIFDEIALQIHYFLEDTEKWFDTYGEEILQDEPL